MRRLLLAAFAGVALFAGTAAAQGGTRQITGTVVEEGSNAPIASAQLQVRGSTTGGLTREDGTFTLRVAEGDIVLIVRRLGYPPVTTTVPARETTVRIVMRRDALKLDQVVISGQATGISRRNLPNSVASVSAEQVAKVSSPSVDQALQGKVAGAQISTSTGAPGGGNRVRIRGISSILGSAQPLYVIDGVITSDVSIGQGTNLVTRAGGTAISAVSQEAPVNRISDINPNDIESIDVLKGSAAAAIYGSKASGGVIIITTKRGAAGRPQFNLRTGLGTGELAYRNGQRRFKTVEDATKAFGPLAAQYYDPNRVLDYEEMIYNGEQPLNREATLSVSGGSQDTRYFISANTRKEEGIVKNSYSQKMGLRVNVDQRLNDRMELQVGSEVLRTLGDRGLFGNDNAGNSIAYTLTKIPSFLDLRRNADGSYPVNPFYNSNPFHTIDAVKNEEGVWRNISTAKLTWDILASKRQELRFVGFGGTDVLNQGNNVYSPPVLQYEPLDGLPGTSTVGSASNVQANVNLNLVHVWRPITRWTATTQLGTQYERRKYNESRSSAQNLLGGLEVVTSGTVRDLSETRILTEDFGVFGQTELLYNDRLLLTVGARADRSSNNGDVGKFYLFPKASASYRLPATPAGQDRRTEAAPGVWRDGEPAAVWPEVHRAGIVEHRGAWRLPHRDGARRIGRATGAAARTRGRSRPGDVQQPGNARAHRLPAQHLGPAHHAHASADERILVGSVERCGDEGVGRRGRGNTHPDPARKLQLEHARQLGDEPQRDHQPPGAGLLVRHVPGGCRAHRAGEVRHAAHRQRHAAAVAADAVSQRCAHGRRQP
ncbi:MAG: TonB-dependent receptor [Gemmatimonadetes bacterium]|nr:TonB-dependent receptor [Gemmatimonadota bacterium]